MSNRISNTVPGTRKRAGAKSIFPSAGAKPAAGGGGGAVAGPTGTDITTFINISYDDYERIKNIGALGNINIVQQPGKKENRSTLSTATNIVKDKDKDVLVVIEQNNTIYSVHQIRYVNRDTNIHASNLRNDVIAAISGIAAIESRPSTGLSAASSSSTLDSSRLDSSRLGSASTISSDNYGLDFERKTPPGTPRIPDDYLDVSKLPERLNTSTTRNIDSSAKQFIAEYNEKSSPEEKGAHLKTVTTETEQKQIIKAISDIEPKHGGLDPPSVLHSHFIHNNKLAQTNKSSSNDFSRAKDMNNKELGIGDTVKVIKSQTTGIKPNDIATIHNILPGNNVVIRRESYATNKTVKGDTLLFMRKFRGGGTRRKRTTKSNNKTRSNRNKNI